MRLAGRVLVVLTVAHPSRPVLTAKTLHSAPPRAPAYDVGAGSVRSMPTLRFRGPVLPDGEPRDLYVVDGRITLEQQPGAETAAEGWIVPGLVDAHCHIGLDAHGAVDEATTEEQAVADRDAGRAPRCATAGRRPTPAGCTTVTTCPA